MLIIGICALLVAVSFSGVVGKKPAQSNQAPEITVIADGYVTRNVEGLYYYYINLEALVVDPNNDMFAVDFYYKTLDESGYQHEQHFVGQGGSYVIQLIKTFQGESSKTFDLLVEVDDGRNLVFDFVVLFLEAPPNTPPIAGDPTFYVVADNPQVHYYWDIYDCLCTDNEFDLLVFTSATFITFPKGEATIIIEDDGETLHLIGPKPACPTTVKIEYSITDGEYGDDGLITLTVGTP